MRPLRWMLLLSPVLAAILAAILFGPAAAYSWRSDRIRANLRPVARTFEKARLDYRRDHGEAPRIVDLIGSKSLSPYTLGVLAQPTSSGFLDRAQVDGGRLLWSGTSIDLGPTPPIGPQRLGSLVLYPLADASSVNEWSLVILPSAARAGEISDYLVVWSDVSAEWIPAAEFAERFADRNRRRRDLGRAPLVDPREVPDLLLSASHPEESSP